MRSKDNVVLCFVLELPNDVLGLDYLVVSFISCAGSYTTIDRCYHIVSFLSSLYEVALSWGSSECVGGWADGREATRRHQD